MTVYYINAGHFVLALSLDFKEGKLENFDVGPTNNMDELIFIFE